MSIFYIFLIIFEMKNKEKLNIKFKVNKTFDDLHFQNFPPHS